MRLAAVLAALAACEPTPEPPPPLEGDPGDTGLVTSPPTTPPTPSPTTPTPTGCGTPAERPFSGHPLDVAGAPVTPDEYTVDAGLTAVRDAATGLTEPETVSLAVAGAVITAVDFVPAGGTFASFWLQDSSGPLVAFGVELPEADQLAPGDEVSFTATEVDTYFGLPQLRAVDDWSVTSSGNPVQVLVAEDVGLDYAVHGERVVEVWGEITEDRGACGGQSTCFGLTWGPDDEVVELRTESTFDEVGDCIHYVGPLGAFSEMEQLNAGNFDWYQSY